MRDFAGHWRLATDLLTAKTRRCEEDKGRRLRGSRHPRALHTGEAARATGCGGLVFDLKPATVNWPALLAAAELLRLCEHQEPPPAQAGEPPAHICVRDGPFLSMGGAAAGGSKINSAQAEGGAPDADTSSIPPQAEENLSGGWAGGAWPTTIC